MREWIRFFVGTPRRFLTTMTVLCLIGVLIRPGLLRTAVERFVVETSPLIHSLLGPLLAILIVIFGMRVVWSSIIGGGGKKRRR